MFQITEKSADAAAVFLGSCVCVYVCTHLQRNTTAASVCVNAEKLEKCMAKPSV